MSYMLKACVSRAVRGPAYQPKSIVVAAPVAGSNTHVHASSNFVKHSSTATEMCVLVAAKAIFGFLRWTTRIMMGGRNANLEVET